MLTNTDCFPLVGAVILQQQGVLRLYPEGDAIQGMSDFPSARSFRLQPSFPCKTPILRVLLGCQPVVYANFGHPALSQDLNGCMRRGPDPRHHRRQRVRQQEQRELRLFS